MRHLLSASVQNISRLDYQRFLPILLFIYLFMQSIISLFLCEWDLEKLIFAHEYLDSSWFIL